MSRLYGTVVSGFAGRTTMGNTSFNLALAMMYTLNLNALHFAAGDDCFMVVEKKDVQKIVSQIEKLVAKSNPDLNGPGERKVYGSGCIIGDDFRVDDTLITFLSKVIDPEYNSCVRQLDKYYATSLVSDSVVSRGILNYNNIAQLKDYFKMSLFNSIEPYWNSQEIEIGLLSKKKERELKFRAEFDKGVNDRNPLNYIRRGLDVGTGYEVTLTNDQHDRDHIKKISVSRLCNNLGSGIWH